jgi:glutamate formiminotransferase/formiminotetrahydrofolate cyclodeaminase
MPNRLVECIPNFSEARRPEVVEAIQQAISEVNGVQVLDRHSDLDHNRTVITFVGEPEAVEEAAYQGIERAAELIDLNHHTGEHPRIGATDVVPFVPIAEISMEECIEMARRLGKRAGDDLNIPIYLYEEAATRPERHNLENIRRGQYEALKDEIGTNPEREPDFGPSKVGSAGATVIGARQPLIAYNVYLTTDDVQIAQKIAKAIRHSSGGLRFVKALGLLVEGRAQVSMNLTNYHQTPIGRVVEMVRREALRYGTSIHHSELVGLIPQEAMIEAAQWYLQIDGFNPNQILETRLYDLLQARPEPGPRPEPAQEPDFLDRLAEGSATPGGGSAAAHTGAAAAALVAMVARLTLGKKKYAPVEARMKEIIQQAEHIRAHLQEAVSRDSAAFTQVMDALHLPKDTPEQQAARKETVEKATQHAAQVPLEVVGWCGQILDLALEVAETGNVNAISDAASAAALAQAAMTSAALNVRVNAASLNNQEEASQLREQLFDLENQIERANGGLRRILVERAGLPA